MYTQEDLEKMTKLTLFQFIDSFYGNSMDGAPAPMYDEKGKFTPIRKYSLRITLQESGRTYSNIAKASKAELIQYILEYQNAHPDDTFEFCQTEEEMKRQRLTYKTQRQLQILCVEKGYALGTYCWDAKWSQITALMGENPFSGPMKMLTQEQKAAFLTVLKDTSLSYNEYSEKVQQLREEYHLDQ